MYIESLKISNLRSFEEAELKFCVPGLRDEATAFPNVNLLLGNNGAGKTTVLRSIALSALARLMLQSGFVPYNFVRRAPIGRRHPRHERARRAHPDGYGGWASARGIFLLHAQDMGREAADHAVPAEIMATIDLIGDEETFGAAMPTEQYRRWEALGLDRELYSLRSPAFFIVGYGASRRVEAAENFDSSLRAKSRRLRYQRVASLFEEQVTLTPLGAWLPALRKSSPSAYKKVVELINKLLPDECRLTHEREKAEHVFMYRNTPVPFSALSDGYRAYIGWIADLVFHLRLGLHSDQKLTDSKGIVLVDEVDLHLHPEWQREVVPRLARTLPNLQFVFTTHSPIVAGTLHARNIHLIEQGPQGSVIKRLEERIHGLNADQILLSSYFGLKSTRAIDAVNELRELSRNAQKGDSASVIKFLRKLSDATLTDEEKERLDGAPKAGRKSTARSARRATRK